MSIVTFRSVTVSRADVLRALAEFDAAYGDDSNAYDGWMDKAVPDRHGEWKNSTTQCLAS